MKRATGLTSGIGAALLAVLLAACSGSGGNQAATCDRACLIGVTDT